MNSTPSGLFTRSLAVAFIALFLHAAVAQAGSFVDPHLFIDSPGPAKGTAKTFCPPGEIATGGSARAGMIRRSEPIIENGLPVGWKRLGGNPPFDTVDGPELTEAICVRKSELPGVQVLNKY